MPTRPCWVEIRTRAFEENYRFLASLAAPHAELLAIVKANAYGHSLEFALRRPCAPGREWLGVTSVEEGMAARALCPEARVLVIGGVFPGQGAEAIDYQLTAVAWEPWQLDELMARRDPRDAPAGSVPIHLEIDTGMSRQGVSGALGRILARLGAGSALRLEGVMTHLFAADEADGAVTAEQLALLDEVLGRICAGGLFAGLAQRGQLGRAAGGPGARDRGFGRPPRDEGHAAAGAGALWTDSAISIPPLARRKSRTSVAAARDAFAAGARVEERGGGGARGSRRRDGRL